MGKQLAANVNLDGVLYEAGSTPPADIAEQITNPKAWGDSDSGDDATAYSSMKKADLEAEVARRNEGRNEGDVIQVAGKGTVADLVTALEADDAAASA